MSEYREKLDEEIWQRMLDDEFADARAEVDAPMYRRYQLAQDEGKVLRRGTYDELRELKILEHMCPWAGCSGTLDEAFYCSACSNVSFPKVLPDEEAKAA